MAFTLNVNGKAHSVDIEPETPLLWVLRDTIGLTGTKYGCGIAQCGACTVHVDGVATKSCSINAAGVVGKKVTTIEGLSPDRSHPLQKAWIEHTVPQCGYCQSGQRDRSGHGGQPLPVRNLSADSSGNPHRRQETASLRGRQQ
jgi:aerobic-type carbon monoxide dehydrogenase small subunit (CoxS/CutS family)